MPRTLAKATLCVWGWMECQVANGIRISDVVHWNGSKSRMKYRLYVDDRHIVHMYVSS